MADKLTRYWHDKLWMIAEIALIAALFCWFTGGAIVSWIRTGSNPVTKNLEQVEVVK